MRKEVERLLKTLAATHSKRTLVALWSDIRRLSKTQFEEVISVADKAQETAPAATRRSAPREEVPEDTPEDRIKHILLKRCKLNTKRAASEVREQLVRQGVDPSKIIVFEKHDFCEWLRILFLTVPAGRVMHAALQIAERRRA